MICNIELNFISNQNGADKTNEKKGNKQCLFDTHRTVMVDKEMMSEYLGHKNNCVCLIIAQS